MVDPFFICSLGWALQRGCKNGHVRATTLRMLTPNPPGPREIKTRNKSSVLPEYLIHFFTMEKASSAVRGIFNQNVAIKLEDIFQVGFPQIGFTVHHLHSFKDTIPTMDQMVLKRNQHQSRTGHYPLPQSGKCTVGLSQLIKSSSRFF